MKELFVAAAGHGSESYLGAHQPAAAEFVDRWRPVIDRLVEEAGDLGTVVGAAAFRRALHREMEQRHGVPVAARAVPCSSGSAGDVAAAERVREASSMLPANWVRRANMEEVRVRYNGRNDGASYDVFKRLLVVPDELSAALHGYVHHVQSMASHLDVYFYEFHRQRGLGLPIGLLHRAGGGEYSDGVTGRGWLYVDGYAGREYDAAASSSFIGGAPAAYRDPDGRPLEVMASSLQQVLGTVSGDDLLGQMYRSAEVAVRDHNRALFDLAVSLLLSGGNR